jgi:hypothetical protein
MRYRIAKILALIIGIEACLVMIGWVFSIDSLTRILPDGINMKFPTALMFFFSAFGLYYIIRIIENNYELSRVILPGISLFIFLIMSTLLATGLSGEKIGIEDFFIVAQSSANSLGLGLPSILTAINFIIFGLACMFSLSFDANDNYKKLKFFSYPILITGLIAVLGYGLHLPILYYQFSISTIPMALNTALTFILLGSGLIIMSFAKTANET